MYKPQNLPMCVIVPFSFFVKQELMCKLRNKSEISTLWQNVTIVFKQIIVVQILSNIEWCHFALICTLIRLKRLRRRLRQPT